MANSPEVSWIGRLGGDPEIKFTAAGKALASFSFVVSERWKGKDGEWNEKASWWRVTAWDELAENIAQSFSTGDEVWVHGITNLRAYETADGEKKTSAEITAFDVSASTKRARIVIERIVREKHDGAGATKKTAKGRATQRSVRDGDGGYDPNADPGPSDADYIEEPF